MVVYNVHDRDENGNEIIIYKNEVLDEIRNLSDDNKFKKELIDLENTYNKLINCPEIQDSPFGVKDEIEDNTSNKLVTLMRKYRREQIISAIDKIYIVDAIMGIGKTSYILNLLNNQMFYENVSEEIAALADEGLISKAQAKKIQIQSTPKRFIAVVPTLDEVRRYKNELKFVETLDPKTKYEENKQEKTKYSSKLDCFKDYVKQNNNVVTTHALIKLLDNEAMELLRNSNYILIIDEELNVVEPFSGAKSKDIEILFDTNLVTLDDDGFLIWNEDDDERPFKYDDIKRLCRLNSLMLYNRDKEAKKLLIWHFPFPFFGLFKQTYICTYQWNGSIQRCYFDLHNVKYEHLTLNEELYPYDAKSEKMYREKFKKLINIYDGELNDIGAPYHNSRGKATQPLTKSWYDKMYREFKNDLILEQQDGKKREGNLIKLKNNIYNYIRNVMNAKSNDIMWTCYQSTWIDNNEDEDKASKKTKVFHGILKGKGYSLPECFAPVNCKGTNQYGNRHVLVYACNYYLQPQIKNFFKFNGIEIDEDMYSLNALLQWIWRSAIRNNEPITIYIPSLRMRTLLQKWLNGEI